MDRPPKRPSAGQRDLDAWARASIASGTTVAELAAAIGVSAETLSSWRLARRVPGPLARDRLAAVAGVPVASWGQP